MKRKLTVIWKKIWNVVKYFIAMPLGAIAIAYWHFILFIGLILYPFARAFIAVMEKISFEIGYVYLTVKTKLSKLALSIVNETS